MCNCCLYNYFCYNEIDGQGSGAMKKFIAVFILSIMALVTAGCGEAGSEVQAENQPVVVEYKDIDPEAVQI